MSGERLVCLKLAKAECYHLIPEEKAEYLRMIYQTCCRKGLAEAAEAADLVLKIMLIIDNISINNDNGSGSSSNDIWITIVRLAHFLRPYSRRMPGDLVKIVSCIVYHSFAFAAFLKAKSLRYSASHSKTTCRLCFASI